MTRIDPGTAAGVLHRGDPGPNMSPRPQPVHKPTQSAPNRRVRHSEALSKQPRPRAIDFFSEPEECAARAHSSLPQTHHADEGGPDQETSRDSEEDRDEDGIDAPRVAQWIDDEELDLQYHTDDASASLCSGGMDDDDGSDESEAEPSQRLRSLKDDLSTLPLGTLRNAQRSLAQAQALSDTTSDCEERSEDDLSPSEAHHSHSFSAKGKFKEITHQPSNPKIAVNKRANKHAPVEVTSKRPVSRRRVVVDDTLPKPRDPRFIHAAGRYEPSKFIQQYDFLSDLRGNELLALRDHVKRAKRLLANSPSHLTAEREEEVKRLEHALKRAESAVNLDNRERVESKALQTAKQAEKEKRKQGKAGWWMKHSEKKVLLAKARMDLVAMAGGKQAVKKAVEKKQKKISQKEKKKRPFSGSRNQRTERREAKRRRVV